MYRRPNRKQQSVFTLISLVSISPSEASSWCVSTYLWHLERAFSLAAATLIALGMIGCMTVPKSKLEGGLWSTHLSPPAECERRWRGRTGVAVCGEIPGRTVKETTNQEIIDKWRRSFGVSYRSSSVNEAGLVQCWISGTTERPQFWAFFFKLRVLVWYWKQKKKNDLSTDIQQPFISQSIVVVPVSMSTPELPERLHVFGMVPWYLSQ